MRLNWRIQLVNTQDFFIFTFGTPMTTAATICPRSEPSEAWSERNMPGDTAGQWHRRKKHSNSLNRAGSSRPRPTSVARYVVQLVRSVSCGIAGYAVHQHSGGGIP